MQEQFNKTAAQLKKQKDICLTPLYSRLRILRGEMPFRVRLDHEGAQSWILSVTSKPDFVARLIMHTNGMSSYDERWSNQDATGFSSQQMRFTFARELFLGKIVELFPVRNHKSVEAFLKGERAAITVAGQAYRAPKLTA